VWKVQPDNEPEEEKTKSDNGTFKMRSVWQKMDHKIKKKSRRNSCDNVSIAPSIAPDTGPQEEVLGVSNSCLGRRICYPYSPRRLVWDLAGMVFLAYDMVVIPIGAFNPPSNWFLVAMDWITLSFWSSDMVASFLTGYIDKGRGATMMNPYAIAKHYLRTWFFLDLTIVGFDWAFVIMSLDLEDSTKSLDLEDSTKPESGNVGKLLRIFRVVRIVRLLRLAKMQKLLSLLKDRIDSELVFLMLAVAQFVIALLFVNHLIGSAWWLVGELSQGTDNNSWIDLNHLADEPLYYRYVTSLHWSLSNFGPGTMTMQPQSSGERSYAIIVLVVGMTGFATFTASLTNKMMQLRDSQSETSKQFWLLRKYLRQNGVPRDLFIRILRNTEYACARQQHAIQESTVTILSVLSEQLRSELTYRIYFSRMLEHPLFDEAHQKSEVLMQSLAGGVLLRKSLAHADYLFEEGMLATHMYYVVSGKLVYSRPTEQDVDVMPDDWMCEQALWVQWYHLGTAQAEVECPVIYIDVHALGEAIRADPGLWALAGRYGKNFVDWLNEADTEDLSDHFQIKESIAMVKKFIPSIEEQEEYLAEMSKGAPKKPLPPQDYEAPAPPSDDYAAFANGTDFRPPGSMPPPTQSGWAH